MSYIVEREVVGVGAREIEVFSIKLENVATGRDKTWRCLFAHCRSRRARGKKEERSKVIKHLERVFLCWFNAGDLFQYFSDSPAPLSICTSVNIIIIALGHFRHGARPYDRPECKSTLPRIILRSQWPRYRLGFWLAQFGFRNRDQLFQKTLRAMANIRGVTRAEYLAWRTCISHDVNNFSSLVPGEDIRKTFHHRKNACEHP